MTWNIWILIGLLAINLFYGLLKGFKNSIIRLVIMILTFAGSIGLAILIQQWAGGFELLSLFNSANPQVQVIISWMSQLIPFGNTISPFLNTYLYMTGYSMLVALLIFLILNKITKIIYDLLAGLVRAHKTVKDVLPTTKEKPKEKIKKKVLSIIFGGLVGLIQGVIVCIMFYAPICEIVGYFI